MERRLILSARRGAAFVIAAAAFAAALLLAAAPASAQMDLFGQNKIQYHRFDWRIMEGEHVRLYYYREEEELARYALRLAEDAYRALRVKFRVEPEERVPLILYNSHHHFEETNLAPDFLPEGVGGFTEYLRGRVALPFTGSYAELAHVIRHEMVHVFQRAALTEVYRLHRRNDFAGQPLWFTEGLAEHWSHQPGSDAAMVLRDFTLDQPMPTVSDLDASAPSAALYPIGASLVAHIAARFGEERLRLLYEDLWRESSWPRVLEAVTGARESEITESWHQELKERTFPLVATTRDVETGAESLLPEHVPGRMPTAASPRPAGARTGGGGAAPGDASPGDLVYISTRLGRISIFMQPLRPDTTGQVRPERTRRRELVTSETEERFESFHPGVSRIDVSRDRRLAFVSKYQDRDALYALPLDGGRIEGPYDFEPLIALFSPSWSPEGTRLVFSSLSTDGMSDLYIFTPATRRLERITHDRNVDSDPDWSPDGRYVVFASDRGESGAEGYENLWLYDVERGTLAPFTSGRWNDRGPRWSPDGSRVLCVSDRGGIGNPTVLDVLDNGGTPVGGVAHELPFLTGSLEADWTPDGRAICFSSYRRASFGLYRAALPDSLAGTRAIARPADSAPIAESAVPTWSWPALPDSAPRVSRYRPEYGLDIAQGAISYSVGGNFDQGVEAVLSDALNDRLVLVSLAYNGDSIDRFFQQLSAGAFFINLGHRMHYGWGAFQYVGDFEDQRGNPFFERRIGMNFVGAYPFSRFHRVETGILLAHSDKNRFPLTEHRRRMIGLSYVAWVHDQSVWNALGPAEGNRERVALGSTMDITHASPENLELVIDLRRYLQVAGPLSYAVRAFGAASTGSDPDLFVLGGSWNLRGYRWNSLVGTRAALLSQEFRFPLLAPMALFESRSLRLPSIQGALFLDAGNAWDRDERVDRLIGSWGLGARMGFGGLTAIRLDVAWPTDFHHTARHARTDLFIGWNF